MSSPDVGAGLLVLSEVEGCAALDVKPNCGRPRGAAPTFLFLFIHTDLEAVLFLIISLDHADVAAIGYGHTVIILAIP